MFMASGMLYSTVMLRRSLLHMFRVLQMLALSFASSHPHTLHAICMAAAVAAVLHLIGQFVLGVQLSLQTERGQDAFGEVSTRDICYFHMARFHS
jgi:hypothetical protein